MALFLSPPQSAKPDHAAQSDTYLFDRIAVLARPVIPCRWDIVAFMLALISVGFILSSPSAQEKGKAEPPPSAAPALVAAPAPTIAAPATPEKANNARPAWTVGCYSAARSAPLDCKIEQRLFVRETGRALSLAVIDVPGGTQQPVLMMHLPNGLALQDGASLTIDDAAPTPLQWQSCDGNGCYAILALSPALIDLMKKGRVMTVKAIAANREPLAFQHLLTDFAAAYESAR